jgi:predicted nucleic acid-binding protein
MPRPKQIVINTSPLLALIAGLGSLEILGDLYETVFVPYEVQQEILRGGKSGFGTVEFEQAKKINKLDQPLSINPLLLNSLDLGEASVIQLALNLGIATVCIDEAIGRRVARLSGLKVTGSIGILLRAKKEGYDFSMQEVINRMVSRGIRLGQTVIEIALKESGEV